MAESRKSFHHHHHRRRSRRSDLPAEAAGGGLNRWANRRPEVAGEAAADSHKLAVGIMI